MGGEVLKRKLLNSVALTITVLKIMYRFQKVLLASVLKYKASLNIKFKCVHVTT